MNGKRKMTVRAVIVYVVLTVGMMMFICAYANSYNRMNAEKIVPAAFRVAEDSAELEIIGERFTLDLSVFRPESKLFLVLYLMSGTELRAEILGMSVYAPKRRAA